MTNPLPPSFPVETQKSYAEVSKQFIDGCLDEKKFKEFIKNMKSPQETSSDSMVMPSGEYSLLWRPNNYRRQIKVKTKSDDTLKKMQGVIEKKNLTLAKVTYVKNYSGCLIMYGKNILTAILAQKIIKGKKEIFCISGNSPDEIYTFIFSKRKEFEKKLDAALDSFSKEFNISIEGEVPVKQRAEDWWRDSALLNELPESAIIYEKLWKKAYSAGIETQTGKEEEDSDKIKNLISNSMVHQFAPDIANEISLMSQELEKRELENFANLRKFIDPVRFVKERLDHVFDVLKHENIIKMMSLKERKEISEYLFTLPEVKYNE